jgi:non-specific serine/threonine protein kinase
VEPTTDIYALAATTYAMLAGHSPFEAPGSAESVFDLARRIVKDPVPPLGRPEAPPSLFRVLSIAMDKDPSRRYRTVLAFARALQQVESELGLPITAVDLYSDSLPAAGVAVEDGPDADSADSAATRIGVFSRVDEPVPPRADAARSAWSSTGDPGRRRWNPLLVGTIATVVVATVVIGAVLLSQKMDEARPTATFATLAPGGSDPLGAVIPQPRTVVGERLGDGTVSFTWLSPQEGWQGTYLYRSDIAGQEDEGLEPTTKPSATIAAQPGSTCIEVYAVQTDGRMSQPVRSCVNSP